MSGFDRERFVVTARAAGLTLPLTGGGTRVVVAGDVVINFRGEAATFVGVERGPEEGRSAKVVIERDGFRRTCYAGAYSLTVTPAGGEAA